MGSEHSELHLSILKACRSVRAGLRVPLGGPCQSSIRIL